MTPAWTFGHLPADKCLAFSRRLVTVFLFERRQQPFPSSGRGVPFTTPPPPNVLSVWRRRHRRRQFRRCVAPTRCRRRRCRRHPRRNVWPVGTHFRDGLTWRAVRFVVVVVVRLAVVRKPLEVGRFVRIYFFRGFFFIFFRLLRLLWLRCRNVVRFFFF